MDQINLRRIIEQSLQKLSPFAFQLEARSEESLKVLVISNAFKDLKSKARFDQVWTLLEHYAPDTLDNFQWTFELWTEAESEKLGIDFSKFESFSHKASDDSAAKPADLG